MKKYTLLLIVPLLFFSIGCDKDEENGPDYSELILGHWKVDYVESTMIDGYIDPVFGTEIMDTVENTIVYPRPVPSFMLTQYNLDYNLEDLPPGNDPAFSAKSYENFLGDASSGIYL